MTPDEIATMSRAVAQHFGLWTPGRCLGTRELRGRPGEQSWVNTPCEHGSYGSHEIPCPDLTEPAWFVRLLKEIGKTHYVDITRFLTAGDYLPWSVIMHRASGARDEVGAREDCPELALLRAAYQLVQREAAK